MRFVSVECVFVYHTESPIQSKISLQLNWRIKCQEAETDIHNQYMSKLQKDIEELKQRHASTTAKMMEHRRKLADLSHRILKVSDQSIHSFQVIVIDPKCLLSSISRLSSNRKSHAKSALEWHPKKRFCEANWRICKCWYRHRLNLKDVWVNCYPRCVCNGINGTMQLVMATLWIKVRMKTFITS